MGTLWAYRAWPCWWCDQRLSSFSHRNPALDAYLCTYMHEKETKKVRDTDYIMDVETLYCEREPKQDSSIVENRFDLVTVAMGESEFSCKVTGIILNTEGQMQTFGLRTGWEGIHGE